MVSLKTRDLTRYEKYLQSFNRTQIYYNRQENQIKTLKPDFARKYYQQALDCIEYTKTQNLRKQEFLALKWKYAYEPPADSAPISLFINNWTLEFVKFEIKRRKHARKTILHIALSPMENGELIADLISDKYERDYLHYFLDFLTMHLSIKSK